jgi:hypothetical protein
VAEPARLSDADRDALATALGRHFAEGRLGADELDRRLELALGAEDAAAGERALAGLPALAPVTPGGRRRRWGRRHGEADVAASGWAPTAERFIDPSTGRVMRVWRDPADGARHYVPEP